MTHKIIYDPEKRYVEARVRGIINFTEIKEIFSKAAHKVKERESVLYLADYRGAILDMSTMELYQLPKLMSDIAASLGINVYELKRAVVIAQGLKESRLDDFRFYETVTTNRGQNTKLFDDIDEAKKVVV
jgi:hypothetical protein